MPEVLVGYLVLDHLPGLTPVESGVGGLILSGGYSWKTNEYGFASDNVVSWDLVTPEGDFVKVTQETQPDLFFALQVRVLSFLGTVRVADFDSRVV